MCGIFCAICASTDEAQAKRKKIVDSAKPFLLRRGPDNFGEKEVHYPLSNDNEKTCCSFIHLAAVVLHLRGECIAKQPVQDSFGNILAWNGEIFAGLEVPAHESDTTALLRNLRTSLDNNSVEHILKTMNRIHGPWAFVYYQANQHTLWFGRDYFGRRSLLWHIPSSPTGLFTLTSVGTRLTEDTGEQFWKEVPASGIYSVDMRKLGEYFSTGDENTKDFQDVLRRYPWQQHFSSEFPVCPVRNPFNREIPDHSTSLTPPVSTNYSKSPCHSPHECENTLVVSKETVADDTQSNIPNDSVVCSRTSSNYVKKGVAVNRDVISIDETTNSVFCRLNDVKYKDDTSTSLKGDGESDHTEALQDCLSSSTKNDELSSTRLAEHLGVAGHSYHIFPKNDEAGSICSTFGVFKLDDQTNQGSDMDVRASHIRQDVVEQFANVLMEAVRRRVFNLPRRREKGSSVPTGEVHTENDNVDKRKGEVYVGNKSRSNVGILFSGGLDSIVLAALADRCVPSEESIDLINVAFGKKSASKGKHSKQGRKNNHQKNDYDGEMCGTNFEVPDRVTGRNGVWELKQINPHRTWNFVEVNVTLEELKNERSNYITHLVSPQSTVLDDSIGCALWFAARGTGNLTCEQCLDNIKELHSSCNHHPSYTCPAKVLLVGQGADEQLGGYARHRSCFNKEGWKGLVDEIEMEVQRISERNLGRDDRCISDHGRESRCPFLDEEVVSFLNALPVWIKCDPRLPRGIGEKIILRQVAKSIGLTGSSELPKRAIQFGSRIAKLESTSEKGSAKCNRF